MADTDFGGLADSRVNDQLAGFKDIKSKEEYFIKLENYFSQSESGLKLLNAKKRGWSSIREEMFKNSSAVDVVEKNQGEVTDDTVAFVRASRFEDRRRKNVRVSDERKTAKNTLRVNLANYRRWRRNPSRSDLKGIDTRRGRAYINLRSFKKRRLRR